MTKFPEFPSGTARVFWLMPPRYKVAGKNIDFPHLLILTPTPLDDQTIVNAWTHAVRYSAKGLDYPDFASAVELLLKRHPSWQIVGNNAKQIAIDLQNAGEDIPEIV